MSAVKEKAQAIRRFLADDAVKEVFAWLEQEAVDGMKVAKDDTHRREAQAYWYAVDRLKVALQAVQDAEEREDIEEQRAKRHLPTRTTREW